MIKCSDCINKESVTAGIQALINKFSILHCFNIISSIILMILFLSSGAGHYYTIFQSFINGTVMILNHPVENNLYRKLCCLPLHLCKAVHRGKKRGEEWKKKRDSKTLQLQHFRSDSGKVPEPTDTAETANGSTNNTNNEAGTTTTTTNVTDTDPKDTPNGTDEEKP